MATIPLVSAPNASTGLLSSSMSAVPTISAKSTANAVQDATAATATGPAGAMNASTYDPANAKASTYNAASMTAKGYDAATAGSQGYDAAQAKLTNWNVGNDATVQGQLSNVLSQSNPLMRAAEAKANQQMNQRGLLNSSMAVKAGQSALYDYALPIATSDAATFGNAEKYNADAANQMSQFNTTASNTAAQFGAAAANQAALANATAENTARNFNTTAENAAASANQNAANTASQFNAQNETQVSLANQNAANQAGQFNAAAQNTANQFNANAANTLQQQNLANVQQVNLANASAYNNAMQNDANRDLQASQSNQSEGVKLVMQNLDSAFKASVANADNATTLAVKDTETKTQLALAELEAKYKSQMQTNTSASNLYQQTVKNITDLVNNKDLTPEARQAAIDQQIRMLNEGLATFASIGDIDISELTNFTVESPKVDTSTPKPGGVAGVSPAITNLYKNILGRDPDEGAMFWENALRNGAPIEEIAAAIQASDEAKSRTLGVNSSISASSKEQQIAPATVAPAGAVNANPVITDLYKSILGRAPDAGGAAFWGNALQSGVPLESIAEALRNSDEAKALKR